MAIDWNNIGSGLINAGMGYWSGSQGVDAAKAAADAAVGSDAKRKASYDLEAARLQGLVPGTAAGMSMKPATATTSFAKSKIDPATGQVGYELTPEAGGLFSGYMTGAQKSLDLAGGMDPKAHAAERLAAQQELLAPQRAAEEANMMRKLQAKGLFGLGSHEGSTSGAQNPFAAALYGARSQADKKAAYESLNEGEAYLDRLLKRSGGMFDYAKDVEGTGRDALKIGTDWTDRFTRNEQEKTRATTDLLKEAYKAERMGGYDSDAEARILNAAKAAGSASAARTSGAITSGAGMLDTILKGAGGLSGIASSIGNLFSGSSTPSWFSGSNFDSGDYGSYSDFTDSWGGAIGDWGTGADFGNFDYADYL